MEERKKTMMLLLNEKQLRFLVASEALSYRYGEISAGKQRFPNSNV